MFKKLRILGFTFLFITQLMAQSPNKMSYQAVIRDGSNNVIVDQNVSVRISILQGSISGNSDYTEVHNTKTNINGLVTIEIGTGSIISGSFTNIKWDKGPYFIKTETDPNGGASYTIIGTSQFLSVPYAIHSTTADSITHPIKEVDGSITNEIQNISQVLTVGNNVESKSLVNVGKIGIGTETPNKSAVLDITSTTGALLLPRMTTSQRDALSPVIGMMVYNTDVYKFQGYSTINTNILDQKTLYNTSSIVFQGPISGNSWQSFKASKTGNLSKVSVKATSGLLGSTLYVYEGEGIGGTLLTSQSFSSQTTDITEVDLSSLISLIQGKTYTIYITNLEDWISTPYTNGGYSFNSGYFEQYPDGISSIGGTRDFYLETYIQNSKSSWIDLH